VGRLGVFALACRPRGPLDDDYVAIFPHHVELGSQEAWDVFDEELARILASADLADVGSKLGAKDSDERHVFLEFTMASHECFHYWLSHDLTALPDRPPRLPDPITHVRLWCADLAGRRVLAWFPDRGWFDPSWNWATA
jgi:hypothetical protein